MRVVELMRETGWSLARTPPTDVLVDLLDAPDVEAQERVLVAAETMIVEELDRLLRGNQSPSFPDVHAAAVEALAAYSSGYFVASQALSTVALTSVIHNHSRPARLKAVRIALKQFDPDKDGLRLFRFASVMRALGTALDEWWHTHPPRERFNRHNSAHSLGTPQYRQVNALTSLMLLVSVELELEYAATETADSL
jgi:hypothetical protein